MPEPSIKSEGKCAYCDKMIAKQAMSRHITAHLQKMENPAGTKEQSFHIQVSCGPFFLHLLMPATASLKTLDSFLRKIWLECCGHLSSFSKGAWGSEEFGMTTKAASIFSKHRKLTYRYDFGSTTELKVEASNSYAIATKSIQLLSRNEPLAVICGSCNKNPAVEICTVHLYDGEGLFCEACAENHEAECPDFADYARMPVVNSPRAGVCAYEGGSIDVARDGVYTANP